MKNKFYICILFHSTLSLSLYIYILTCILFQFMHILLKFSADTYLKIEEYYYYENLILTILDDVVIWSLLGHQEDYYKWMNWRISNILSACLIIVPVLITHSNLFLFSNFTSSIKIIYQHFSIRNKNKKTIPKFTRRDMGNNFKNEGFFFIPYIYENLHKIDHIYPFFLLTDYNGSWDKPNNQSMPFYIFFFSFY